jgi:hypothetical protein
LAADTLPPRAREARSSSAVKSGVVMILLDESW